MCIISQSLQGNAWIRDNAQELAYFLTIFMLGVERIVVAVLCDSMDILP
jgi:hypothetical protein